VESACRSRIARCLSARRDAYRYPDIARAERRVKPKLGCRSVRDFPFHRIRTSDIRSRDRRRFSLLLALLLAECTTRRIRLYASRKRARILSGFLATKRPRRAASLLPARLFLHPAGPKRRGEGEKALRGERSEGWGRRPLAIKHGVSPAPRG